MKSEIAQLAIAFHEHHRCLYEVGGSVRDMLLGKKPHDIDLTTAARPDEIIAILKKTGYSHIYEIGKEYGTIGTRLTDGTAVEITTYRGEVYPSNTRKPIVSFGDSIDEDLARRDFTINAIARNPINGSLIDPYSGINDLNKRIVRCVGSDNLRFMEDPLRMIRSIRFAVQLGFNLECKYLYPSRLSIISQERIQEELNKIILSPNPALGIDYLCETGLMEYIIPEFLALKGINQGHFHIKDAYEHSLMVLHKARNRDHGDQNLIFRLAAMLHDIGKPEAMVVSNDIVTFHSHQDIGAEKARVLLRRLRYSNDIIDAVSHIIEHHMSTLLLKDSDLSTKVVRRFINRIGIDKVWMLLDISICDMRSMAFDRGQLIKEIITKVVDVVSSDRDVVLQSPIDGNEIMELLGISPGPQVKEIKEYLTNLVIDGRLNPSDKNRAKELASVFINSDRLLLSRYGLL